LVGDADEPFSSASWHETVSLGVHFSLVLDKSDPSPVAEEIDAIEGSSGTLQINELPRSTPVS